MLPLIGITMYVNTNEGIAKINQKYYEAVQRAGGIPLAIPPFMQKEAIEALAYKLDGLILSGGPDIDPFYYKETPHPCLGKVCSIRDKAEISIADQMIKLSKPVLGICRGMQVLNVIMGGSLYQDIESEIKESLKHKQDEPRSCKTHEIEIIKEESLIYRIIKQKRIRVNSFHHQSVKTPAPGMLITAVASDGVVEAIESAQSGKIFCLGVQWHPEELIEDPANFKLFQFLVNAARM
ncbi:MAG TPA: gamma-glutamyl-gamma-aminobutyrate hydrolase family protein [Thermoanaerobacterales bacterium]|nr:gamma-glutamyl-gamma-aminobutyrate hydrolase family protein [Thermoanaerobacterales bacterium]